MMDVDSLLEQALEEVRNGQLAAARAYIDEATLHQPSRSQRVRVVALRAGIRAAAGNDWSSLLPKGAL